MTLTRDEPALLRCPFCGGEASYVATYHADHRNIRCLGPCCIGPSTTAGNYEDAVRQWNTRATNAQSATRDELRAKISYLIQDHVGITRGDRKALTGVEKAAEAIADAVATHAQSAGQPSALLRKIIDETADKLIGIQETLPNACDRDVLGVAAHYLRKFANAVPAQRQPDFADDILDTGLVRNGREAYTRDVFAEITAKAIPVTDATSDDPERVRHYIVPGRCPVATKPLPVHGCDPPSAWRELRRRLEKYARDVSNSNLGGSQHTCDCDEAARLLRKHSQEEHRPVTTEQLDELQFGKSLHKRPTD